jgi:superoxide dismutase, Fe-Mn family
MHATGSINKKLLAHSHNDHKLGPMSHNLTRRNALKWGLAAAALTSIGHAQTAKTAFTLPALDYAPTDLEPHIDAQTMTIHHTKHHAAYIAKLNETLAANPSIDATSLETLMANLSGIKDPAVQSTLRNHGGGHWNHAFFWKIMAPTAKTGKPSDALTKAINDSFGSFEQMKTAFADAAMKRFGSGWAWLILQDGKLKITSTANQDNPLMKGIVADSDLGKPLLGNDVWEHAYYLHYQNRRADYVTAWWNVVNWNAVNQHFSA